MIVYNKTNKIKIAGKVERADTFFKRLFGLIPRKNLDIDEGLFIPRCSMIHTCFMRFPIDIVFLDGENRVVFIESFLGPWRFSKLVFKANSVLELKAGVAQRKIGVGDSLQFYHAKEGSNLLPESIWAGNARQS